MQQAAVVARSYNSPPGSGRVAILGRKNPGIESPRTRVIRIGLYKTLPANVFCEHIANGTTLAIVIVFNPQPGVRWFRLVSGSNADSSTSYD